MKSKFIDSSLNLITKYQECDDLKILKLKYGLEGLYGVIIKLIVVITIAILTKNLKETTTILLFYMLIRSFSYGLHAKSSLACWISTIIVYNIFPMITKNLIVPKIIGFIIIGLSLLSTIIWAPADTPKKPLIRKEHRKKCKLNSCIIVIIYFIIYIYNFNNLINNAILYALIIETILINPLTYKITNTQFNSYKYYKRQNMV